MGKFNEAGMAAGKEVADTLQEALDSDGRFNDTFREGLEAKAALQAFYKMVKENGLDKRLAVAQLLRGALNDVLEEDLSLDQVYEPGSQN